MRNEYVDIVAQHKFRDYIFSYQGVFMDKAVKRTVIGAAEITYDGFMYLVLMPENIVGLRIETR
jgi:hypothetical protein